MTLVDRLPTLSVDWRDYPVENRTMAKASKTDARMARFVVEDLGRRRLPVDGLLKEVGLTRSDLASPEGRLPYAPGSI